MATYSATNRPTPERSTTPSRHRPTGVHLHPGNTTPPKTIGQRHLTAFSCWAKQERRVSSQQQARLHSFGASAHSSENNHARPQGNQAKQQGGEPWPRHAPAHQHGSRLPHSLYTSRKQTTKQDAYIAVSASIIKIEEQRTAHKWTTSCQPHGVAQTNYQTLLSVAEHATSAKATA